MFTFLLSGLARQMPMGWTKAVIMKIIPFSPIMEFQRESQRAVQGTGFAESAVWAIFAVTAATSVFFSLSQIAPASVQSHAPRAASVVCDQQNAQPTPAVQHS
jgi:hypothetical protein